MDGSNKPIPWQQWVKPIPKWLQVFAIPEYMSEWLLYWFKRWAILEVIAIVSLVSGIVLYIFGADERREQRIINAFIAIELQGNLNRKRGLELLVKEGVTLSGINLYNFKLSRSKLHKAILYGALLEKVDLTFADLRATNLKAANLTGANFYGANFRDAWLTGANLNGANLTHARNLSCVQLTKAKNWEHTLRDRNLLCDKKIVLQRVNVSHFMVPGLKILPDLSGAVITSVNLSNTYLKSVNLVEANLTQSNLAGANLQHAKLNRADLSGINLHGADLFDADLRESRNLTCEQLKQANNWEKAHRSEDLACGESLPYPPMSTRE